MNTVLVFSTQGGKDHRDLIAGIGSFAAHTDWNVQVQEFDGSPFPVANLLRFWEPIGCIVEGNGNGVTRNTLPLDAFSHVPTVYIGRNPLVVPDGATHIIHNAEEVAAIAARELLTLQCENYAFLGLFGKGWSSRRQAAFAKAVALNGETLHPFILRAGSAELARLERWLQTLPKPCGLFAADDPLAEMALSVCRRARIAVPDEVAVIGVDDNALICERTKPTLTSIRADFHQCGRFAARLLARKILSGRLVPAETLFGTIGIVRRGSTRRMRRNDPSVSAALEAIHAPGGVLLSAQEVLAKFGCSRRSAEMRFRHATGRSVLEEILSARMELARQLLRETDLSIEDIAAQCGYDHSVHFRERFRAATGQNPLAWRKQRL